MVRNVKQSHAGSIAFALRERNLGKNARDTILRGTTHRSIRFAGPCLCAAANVDQVEFSPLLVVPHPPVDEQRLRSRGPRVGR